MAIDLENVTFNHTHNLVFIAHNVNDLAQFVERCLMIYCTPRIYNIPPKKSLHNTYFIIVYQYTINKLIFFSIFNSIPF